MINWLVANWPSVLSVVSMLLGVAVAIAHLAHADAVASKLQSIEDTINSVVKGGQPPAA